MKRTFQLLFLTALIALSACTRKTVIVKTHVPPGQVKKSMPPGQVKKTTGSKSAAPYAPGQTKKASGASASSSNSSNGKAASSSNSSNGKGKGQDKKK
jgi:hypothetical protein